jgi:hypothetical protein
MEEKYYEILRHYVNPNDCATVVKQLLSLHNMEHENLNNREAANSDLVDVMLRFKLRLNIEEWGNYKKGDEDTFYIKLLDEQNGLAKFAIDKQWDIVSCECV